MSIATDIANAFDTDNVHTVATSLDIVGKPGAESYVHAGDSLVETLDAFGECPGAACHSTPDELCNRTSLWIFDDGSRIETNGGRWRVS